MKLALLNPRRYWTAERGLTSLLIFALLYLFVICALTDFRFGDWVADFFFALIIVAGVLTTFKQRWVHVLAIILAVAILALIWEQFLHPGGTLALLDLALKLIFVGLLLAVLVIQVFGSGPVTGHRIRGAIVVYLLLGGAFGVLYRLIYLITPHAFHMAEGLAAGNPENLQRLLTYFSFITLTTTGFGDITPANALTRTLAMFEAMIGQLYLVITIGRLVSLAIITPKDNSPDPKQ